MRCRRAGPRPGTPRRAGALRRARPRSPCGCLPGPAHSQARGPTGRARSRATRPRRRASQLNYPAPRRGGPRPDSPRPEPGYPAAPGGYGTGPARTYRGESGGYPIDPLDPAYPIPAAGYQEEPATGSYRRPAQGYGPGPGYPEDPGYQDGSADGDYRRGRAAGYQDGPATGDYRAGQSGSHRREPADFPGEPRRARYENEPGVADYPDEDARGGYREPGYPDVPATGDYRAGQSGSHRRPAAGGYPGDPSYHPYSGQRGIADYPGEAPGDDSGAYPAGPDYGEGAEWDDTADHSVEEYGSEPEESFPYGPPPGNHDRRERGRYPGRH